LLTDRQNNVLCNLSDNDPVKSNAHWGRHCYDIDVKSWGNTPTNELLVGRWTFEKCGQPVVLQPDEKIKIVLNDDLTGLIAHHFQIQGYWLSNQDPTPRVTKSNFT